MVASHQVHKKFETAVAHICSDARVKETVATKFIKRLDLANKGRGRGSEPYGVTYNFASEIVKDANVQKPSQIIIHSPDKWPQKNGDRFTVSAGKPDLSALLSAAYAIVNFGPGSSVSSLKNIRFRGVSPVNQAAWKKKLAGLQGIKVS